ncbi:HNH endonuclease domain protein [Bacillus phage Troll]|uniref:HNH endonuclease domain protein n=1 Tax=Bacillus phage Troll TaxID=1382932 RepID=S5YPV4_9CAUD|nr:HNH endonuclease [Bacillus phage Troll]AGT13528.1 HNH endonuclease domain protein [Bacillus phage Troll]
MKTRVLNPKHPQYKDYGGRGIKICYDWLNEDSGSTNFCKWAESNGYEEGLTLDRIDVDGNYEPSNCTWSTMQEQCFNRRSNVKYTLNGETKTATEWSRLLGGSKDLVGVRIKKGWSVERAITEPVHRENQRKTTTEK